jgi:tRNA-binding EMAP/Myf-like protein
MNPTLSPTELPCCETISMHWRKTQAPVDCRAKKLFVNGFALFFFPNLLFRVECRMKLSFSIFLFLRLMGIFSFFGTIFGGTPKNKSVCGSCCKKDDMPKALDLTDEDCAILKTVDAKIVIGKIVKITAHPDPKVTKVRVTQTEVAPGVVEQILCGGSNIAEGMLVPVATVGSDLGGGFIIGERKIRGEMSRGMICARAELGLSPFDEQKGEIWALPDHFEAHLGKKMCDLV